MFGFLTADDATVITSDTMPAVNPGTGQQIIAATGG
jgi:hypothetical protein